jgi:hypothetical protein
LNFSLIFLHCFHLNIDEAEGLTGFAKKKKHTVSGKLSLQNKHDFRRIFSPSASTAIIYMPPFSCFWNDFLFLFFSKVRLITIPDQL